MMTSPSMLAGSNVPKSPHRLHHYAFVVRDQEVNRKFVAKRAVAHAELTRWLRGEHDSNDQVRPQADR